MTIAYNDIEVEEERQEIFTELLDIGECTLDELKERSLCALGAREALHASWIAMENVDAYLERHPFITFDEEAFRHAHAAATALFNLYQRISALECEYHKTSGLVRNENRV